MTEKMTEWQWYQLDSGEHRLLFICMLLHTDNQKIRGGGTVIYSLRLLSSDVVGPWLLNWAPKKMKIYNCVSFVTHMSLYSLCEGKRSKISIHILLNML